MKEFERSGCRGVIPDARFGDNIHGPRQRLDGVLSIRLVCTQCSLMDGHPLK